MSASIWDVLGVPPHSDLGTVRRAYATKLRDTNPEDDPEAFKVLRAAYDQARQYASADISALSEQNAAPRPSTRSTAAQAAPTEAIDDSEIDRLNAALGEIHRLLTSKSATGDEDAKAIAQEMFDHPLLLSIEAREAFEQALAGIIASTAPRSDALADLATKHFGWDQAGYRVRSPAIAAILARRELWVQITEFEDTGHSLHRGWNALRGHSVDWHRLLTTFHPGIRHELRILIGSVLPANPELVDYLSREAVDWWVAHFAQPRVADGLPLLPLCWLQSCAALSLIRGVRAIDATGVLVSFPIGCGLALIYAMLLRPWIISQASHLQIILAWPRWAVAFFGLVVLATTLPQSRTSLAIGLLATAIVLCWNGLLLRFFPPSVVIRGPGQVPFRLAMIAMFSLMMLPSLAAEAVLQWAIFVSAMTIAWHRTIGVFARLAAGLPSLARRTLPFIAVGLLVKGAALSGADGPYYAGFVILAFTGCVTVVAAWESQTVRMIVSYVGRVVLWFWLMAATVGSRPV